MVASLCDFKTMFGADFFDGAHLSKQFDVESSADDNKISRGQKRFDLMG